MAKINCDRIRDAVKNVLNEVDKIENSNTLEKYMDAFIYYQQCIEELRTLVRLNPTYFVGVHLNDKPIYHWLGEVQTRAASIIFPKKDKEPKHYYTDEEFKSFLPILKKSFYFDFHRNEYRITNVEDDRRELRDFCDSHEFRCICKKNVIEFRKSNSSNLVDDGELLFEYVQATDTIFPAEIQE